MLNFAKPFAEGRPEIINSREPSPLIKVPAEICAVNPATPVEIKDFPS